jgi:hypothetical protein
LSDPKNPVNFEALLYEGQNRFDLVYGPVQDNGVSATVGGVVGGSAAFVFLRLAALVLERVTSPTRASRSSQKVSSI